MKWQKESANNLVHVSLMYLNISTPQKCILWPHFYLKVLLGDFDLCNPLLQSPHRKTLNTCFIYRGPKRGDFSLFFFSRIYLFIDVVLCKKKIYTIWDDAGTMNLNSDGCLVSRLSCIKIMWKTSLFIILDMSQCLLSSPIAEVHWGLSYPPWVRSVVFFSLFICFILFYYGWRNRG